MAPSTNSTTLVHLTAPTVHSWKWYIATEALKINGLHILTGAERYPDVGYSHSDPKIVANYKEQPSKMAGILISTLDDALVDTLVIDIKTIGVAKVYKELLKTFEPKIMVSRAAVLQELMALCNGFEGFEEESYQEYGACVMGLEAVVHLKNVSGQLGVFKGDIVDTDVSVGHDLRMNC